MGRYRQFDHDFRQGAVRLVFETGKPIARVARELGVNEGTLGNWVARARRERGDDAGALGEDERAELQRLQGWRSAEGESKLRSLRYRHAVAQPNLR